MVWEIIHPIHSGKHTMRNNLQKKLKINFPMGVPWDMRVKWDIVHDIHNGSHTMRKLFGNNIEYGTSKN